jgi:hypothetical protein
MAHAAYGELEPRHDVPPRSARWPWARGGLSGIIAMLLPFTWVIDLDGCTASIEGRRTGFDLLRDLPFDALDLVLVVFLLTLAIAAPRWAGLAERSSTRLGVHIAGLAATAALAFEGLSLLFGRVEVRAIQPAGYLVLASLLGCFVDAIARVVLGTVEWNEERGDVYARDG